MHQQISLAYAKPSTYHSTMLNGVQKTEDKSLSILSSLPVATVYEAAGKIGEMNASIRPVAAGTRVCGPAYTVKCLAGEARAVLEAIEDAPVGAVLVADAGDTPNATIWGGTSSLACTLKGIAGFVTNAAVRDVEEIRRLQFPVFSAGICLRGTQKNHPGWRQLPVGVGGAVVSPGDVVIGDDDGVMVVPANRADEVAAAALEQKAREDERESRQRAGESIGSVLGLGASRS